MCDGDALQRLGEGEEEGKSVWCVWITPREREIVCALAASARGRGWDDRQVRQVWC